LTIHEQADNVPASTDAATGQALVTRSAARDGGFRQGWRSINRWLEENTWLPVLVVVAGGLLARILVALPAVINPDEAMHVLRSSEPTFRAVLREDLKGPDPSFLHLLLFPLCKLYASDFVLRLPSIIAGTLTIFFGYKWLKELFDNTTGLIGAVVLAFAPSLIYLSAEVRAYALVLCFSAWALFCLEAALRRRSVGFMLLFGVAQCLALVSQYSAVFILFVAGCYSLYIVLRGRVRAGLLRSWLASEVTTVGLLGFLYVTHISKLRGGSVEASVMTGFLSRAYFNPARESVLGFVTSRTVAAFGFLFSSRGIGIVGLALFLAGIAWLLVRGISRDGGRGQREAAILLVLPWVTTAAGGVLALYPFAGTRHIAILIIPAAASIAFAIRQLIGPRPAIILLAALVLVPVWNVMRFPFASGWRQDSDSARRSHVLAAADFVRRQLPDGGIIFADLESDYVFRRYLFKGRVGTWEKASPGMFEHSWNGYRMITLDYWKVSADSFGNAFQHMAESYGLEPGTPVYVVSCGWSPNIARYLEKLDIEYPDVHEFGSRVAVLTIPVGSQVMTPDLKQRMDRTGQGLYALAFGLSRDVGRQFKTVFWPSGYSDRRARQLTDRLGLVTMSYSVFYDLAVSGKLALRDLLPAIAFWAVGTRERHLQFMDFMNDGDNYIADGLRFTVLSRDPYGLVVVYAVDAAVAP
jgi:hypothetical protein